MAELDVSSTYLITIGRGNGPETWVEVCVNNEDGKPITPDFPKNLADDPLPVEVFVVLSATFGPAEIPLHIVEFFPQETGFFALRVELKDPDIPGPLEKISPVTLGVVVEANGDRGQALSCACNVGQVTSWFPERTQEPPKR